MVPKKSIKKDTYRRGLWAEYIAMAWLVLKGYRILAHRWKKYVGEIDIVARRKNMLVFIEVKQRPTFEQGLWAITPKQQKRLRAAALFYMSVLQKNPGLQARFDIILVKPYGLKHLQHYWGYEST